MATYPNQGPGPYVGYGIPEAPPRPLGEVISELPRQYLNVLTKPSAQTFAAELGKAEWRSVWLQLLGWGIFAAIIGFLAWLVAPFAVNLFPGLTPQAVQAFVPHAPYGGQIVSVPLGFFFWMGLFYLMAKVFNGQGTFLGQCYASVLFQTPLGLISSILAVIPYLSWINVALFIYGIVLQVFAIMAAHRMSGGRATAVVLLPAVAILVLIIVFAIVFASALISTLVS